jgi:hypothetical protein
MTWSECKSKLGSCKHFGPSFWFGIHEHQEDYKSVLATTAP